MLDEPTVYLPRRDVTRLFELLRRLRDEGRAILLVSHDLEEVLEVTDRVTVLRNGRNVSSRPTAEVSAGDLVSMIVGRELEPGPRVPCARPGRRRPRRFCASAA